MLQGDVLQDDVLQKAVCRVQCYTVKFLGCYVAERHVTWCSIVGYSVARCCLAGCSVQGAVFQYVVLQHPVLQHVVLQCVVSQGAMLQDAVLQGVMFLFPTYCEHHSALQKLVEEQEQSWLWIRKFTRILYLPAVRGLHFKIRNNASSW